MSNLDTFYNKKRNFPDAEEREFDDLSPIPATLYRVGALVDGVLGVSTIKGRHGIERNIRKKWKQNKYILQTITMSSLTSE